MEDLEIELTKALDADVFSLIGMFTLDVTKHLQGRMGNCDTLTALHRSVRRVATRYGYLWSVSPSNNQVFVTMYNTFYT